MKGRSGACSRHYALMRSPARGAAACDAAGGSARRAAREASSAGARAAGLGLAGAAVAGGAAGHGSGRTSPSESPSTSCAMRLSKNGRLQAGGASAACPDGRGFAAHAGCRAAGSGGPRRQRDAPARGGSTPGHARRVPAAAAASAPASGPPNGGRQAQGLPRSAAGRLRARTACRHCRSPPSSASPCSGSRC